MLHNIAVTVVASVGMVGSRMAVADSDRKGVEIAEVVEIAEAESVFDLLQGLLCGALLSFLFLPLKP